MTKDERVIQIRTRAEFDRELARDSGETLAVPAHLAAEYGLFPEAVGTDDEIREAVAGPGAGERDGDDSEGDDR